MNDHSTLRDDFEDLAEQAYTLDATRIIAGARRRRAHRRAGAIAVAGALLAPLDTPPASPTSSPPPGMPSAPVPPRADDVVVDGIRYRGHLAGERLSGAAIGTRGQTSVELTTKISDRTIFRPLCSSRRPTFLVITVDGLDVANSRAKLSQACEPRALTGPEDRRAFSALDTLLLLPPSDLYGKNVRIRAFLVDMVNGKPAAAATTDAGARIALGVYERHSTRQVGRYQLPTVREYQGVTYRLSAVRSEPRSTSKPVQIETPADTPFLVSFGSDTGGQVTLTGLPGRWTWGGTAPYGDLVTVPQPARTAGTITAKPATKPVPGKTDHGLTILAVYVPAK
jgi:hypothetical protein